MFGKRLWDYVAFEKAALVLIVAVGLARLGLSLAGVPNGTVKWLPMNAVLWGATLYYGVAVHTSGFGSYKQLLPLALGQVAVFQAVAVFGILLAIAGFPNIFAAPEYSFPGSQWVHVLAHLTIGVVVPVLLLWGVSSLVMLITKKTTRQPATA